MASGLEQQQQQRIRQLERRNRQLQAELEAAVGADQLSEETAASEPSAIVSPARVHRDRRTTRGEALVIAEWLRDCLPDTRLVAWRAMIAELERRGLSPLLSGLDDKHREQLKTSLQTAKDEIGSAASKPQYEVLYRSRPELRLLSPSTVQLWLGSWLNSYVLLGEEPPRDLRAYRLRALGPAFTEAEIAAMLRAAAKAQLPRRFLSTSAFWAWVDSERANPTSEFDRLPRDKQNGVFRRLGGFFACCLRADVISYEQARRCLIPEVLLAMLRRTAKHIGSQVLRFEDYLAWAEIEDQDPQSPYPLLPRSRDMFIERFGSWNAACAAAGLVAGRVCEGERHRGGAKVGANTYSDKALLSRLRDNSEDLGGGYVTEHEFRIYEDWMAGAASDDGGPRVAFVTSMYRDRFGSWPQAHLAAGIIDAAEARRLGQRGRLTDDEVRADAHAALRKLGRDIKRSGYRAFRSERIKRAEGPRHRVASDFVIAARFGAGNFNVAMSVLWDQLPGGSHGQAA